MTGTEQIVLRKAVNPTTAEEMQKDDMVFLMGEDVGVYGGDFGTPIGIFEEFGPGRIRDTPISEAVTVRGVTGATITGLRPTADVIFMDFITVTLDAIIDSGTKNSYTLSGGLKTPITFHVAFGSDIDSAAQHLQSLETWLAHTPGAKVVAPGSTNDAKGSLKPATRDNNIVTSMEPKTLYGKKKEVNLNSDFYLPPRKGDIKCKRTNLTVVSYDRMLERVLQAADEVAVDGVSVEVVGPRTLIPLDEESIIDSVKKTGKPVLVNDTYKTGDFIGEIAALVAESKALDYLDYSIVHLADEDMPVPCVHVLEQGILLDVVRVKTAIYKMAHNGRDVQGRYPL